MDPVGVIDFFALAGSVAAVYFIVRGWRCSLGGEVRVLFAVIALLVLFRNMSNVLEWSGITSYLDELEDYTEILLPVLWLFVFYGFLQGIADAERDRLNRTLAAKNKELENVVYVASHDLRAPLMNIRGFSHELSTCVDQICQMPPELTSDRSWCEQFKKLTEEDIPESLSYINAAAESMDMVINGLLRLSRAGTEDVCFEKLDMNELIESIRQAKNYQIQEKDISFDAASLPDCFGDKKQVSQIFSNLIDNAIKYLDPKRKGKIEVCGHAEGDECVYQVRDNGIGIAKKDCEKVFEIFRRLNPDHETDGEGLGLTIVARLVERQRGSICLDSEPGRGTTFYVKLRQAKPVKLTEPA